MIRWNGVEVHAERVGQDRLDHVAVADRQPDRVVTVLGLDAPRPGRATAATARAGISGIDSPAGEPRADGLRLHGPPQLLLGQLLSSCPVHSP